MPTSKRLVAEIMNQEIPSHYRVFRRERMKGRYCVLGCKLRMLAAVDGIAARFEQQDLHSRFSQARGYRATSRPRADNDVIVRRPAKGLASSEGLDEFDQGALVVVAQCGLGPKNLLVLGQSFGFIEFRRAEIMASIDHEIRTLAEFQQRFTQVLRPRRARWSSSRGKVEIWPVLHKCFDQESEIVSVLALSSAVARSRSARRLVAGREIDGKSLRDRAELEIPVPVEETLERFAGRLVDQVLQAPQECSAWES